MAYDLVQLYKTGIKEYLNDPWNYVDLIHVWCGYASLYCQGIAEFRTDGSE